ncbi:MAG TPA: hypothetical protein VFB19_09130 [Mycobacterium sp.]|nr:hypothetical protein [Mycobacterium sp.]
MVVLAVLLTVDLFGGGVLLGRHLMSHSAAPPPTAPPVPTSTGSSVPVNVNPVPDPAASQPGSLQAEFAALEKQLGAKMGVVAVSLGGSKALARLGDWDSGPAWSTIKVPLTIAALREEGTSQVTDPMAAAITESDNAAAESIWESLGDPAAAASKVEVVLREYGDDTTVESRKVRPEFTAFGQTMWPLTNAAQFTAGAFCDPQNSPIFDLMGKVVAGQSWGLGHIAGSRFKGGWGPSPAGNYLVRQIGVLSTPTGQVALAIAAEPSSGSFVDGTNDLTRVANWLQQHIAELPSGKCGT